MSAHASRHPDRSALARLEIPLGHELVVCRRYHPAGDAELVGHAPARGKPHARGQPAIPDGGPESALELLVKRLLAVAVKLDEEVNWPF